MTELSLELDGRKEKTLETLRSVLRLMSKAPGEAQAAREQAKAKLAAGAAEITALYLELQGANDQCDLLSEELARTTPELTKLVDFVLDVDRRVRTGRELIDYVKETYQYELRESVLS